MPIGLSVAGSEAAIAIGRGGFRSDGAVSVHDAKTGDLLCELPAPRRDFSFGSAFPVDGGYLVVGADASGQSRTIGSAFLYRLSTGELLHELDWDGVGFGDEYGNDVAIDGGIAIVSAWRHDDNRGAVVAFDATCGGLLTELTPSDSMPDDFFGTSIAIDGDRVLVGAPFRDAGQDENVGVAYLFIIPEPASGGLLVAGLVCCVLGRRRQRNRSLASWLTPFSTVVNYVPFTEMVSLSRHCEEFQKGLFVGHWLKVHFLRIIFALIPPPSTFPESSFTVPLTSIWSSSMQAIS